jgi:hypothetical protein
MIAQACESETERLSYLELTEYQRGLKGVDRLVGFRGYQEEYLEGPGDLNSHPFCFSREV